MIRWSGGPFCWPLPGTFGEDELRREALPGARGGGRDTEGRVCNFPFLLRTPYVVLRTALVYVRVPLLLLSNESSDQ